MKMTLTGNLTGKDIKTSQKGNAYKVFLLTQGVESMQLMLDKDCESFYEKAVLYKPITVTLDYAPRWRSFLITGVDLNA